MHQAVNEQAIERDEQTKAGDAGHPPCEDFANAVLHELALQPVGDVARGLVGAALGHRAMGARGSRRAFVVRRFAGLLFGSRACLIARCSTRSG